MAIIHAEAPKLTPPRGCSCSFDLGENLDQLVSMYGAAAVYASAVDDLTVSVQSLMRRGMKAGKTDDEIQELINTFRPGTSVRIAGDPLKAASVEFDKLDAAAQDKYIADLMARQKTS
jgi:hypothetical protein